MFTKMEKQILLIASKLLTEASMKFSTHGCNDLSEEVLGVMEDTQEELTKDFRQYFNDNGYPESITQVTDWLLMDYISDKLKELAEGV